MNPSLILCTLFLKRELLVNNVMGKIQRQGHRLQRKAEAGRKSRDAEKVKIKYKNQTDKIY